jgi:hypothetical protein
MLAAFILTLATRSGYAPVQVGVNLRLIPMYDAWNLLKVYGGI